MLGLMLENIVSLGFKAQRKNPRPYRHGRAFRFLGDLLILTFLNDYPLFGINNLSSG